MSFLGMVVLRQGSLLRYSTICLRRGSDSAGRNMAIATIRARGVTSRSSASRTLRVTVGEFADCPGGPWNDRSLTVKPTLALPGLVSEQVT
jgi:hypothetical protein